MSAVERLLRKLVGLFVDDWRFALAIAGWLLTAGLLVRVSGLAGAWAGLMLFTGLAVILIDSVRRRARS